MDDNIHTKQWRWVKAVRYDTGSTIHLKLPKLSSDLDAEQYVVKTLGNEWMVAQTYDRNPLQ